MIELDETTANWTQRPTNEEEKTSRGDLTN